jgi:hypothetical protein
VPSPSVDFTFTASYGQFLDPGWEELVGVRRTWRASYTAKGATGPATLPLGVESEWPVGQLPASPGPVLSPPRALTLGGVDAFQPLTGVGFTPVIAWTAPVLGSPTRYRVSLALLENTSGVTTLSNVASFEVYSTSLTIPDGLLFGSGEYVATVSAIESPNDVAGSLAPWSGDYPFHLASNVTAIFTP